VISIDLIGTKEGCKCGCNKMFVTWGNWIRSSRPFGNAKQSGGEITHGIKPAMIILVNNHSEYLKIIGCKSRNMLTKCHKNGYFGHIINFNDYLKDIYEANTSKEIRQGIPMTEWYKKMPSAQNIRQEDYCELHHIKHYGVLKENKLFAWCEINFMNELAIVNSIIGHGYHLKFGIMNEMISFVVKDCFENHKQVKYINYLNLACGAGLSLFKKSVGFRELECNFKNNL
jgi:hypothetical protein